MIEELKKEVEKKEEAKLLNKIHENYRNARLEREMDEQLKQFSKKESQFSKYESVFKKVAIALLIITILFLGYKYNESQVKSCMDSGKSEMFCRYEGE